MMYDMDDFKNIDIQEELADMEAPDMRSAGDLLERTLDRRDELDEGIDLPWSKMHGYFWLRKGELVLLGGYTGHFKSTITSQIGCYAMRHGSKVGVCSLELKAEDVIEQFAEISSTTHRPSVRYMENWCAWADDKLVVYDRLDAIEPHDAIRMAIKFAQLGCDLVILDCLMMMGVCDDLEREREFVQTLVRVAKKFGVTVLLVHHMKKPQGQDGEHSSPGKYMFNGTSHISNTPDSIVIVWHDKQQAALRAKVEDMGVPDQAYDPDRRDMLFTVHKQRNGKYEGSIALWQAKKSRAFVARQDRKIHAFDPPEAWPAAKVGNDG